MDTNVSGLVLVLGLAGALLVPASVLGSHAGAGMDSCDKRALLETCRGRIVAKDVVNPAFWETPALYDHSMFSQKTNRPAWILVQSGGGDEPIHVTVSAQGGVIGSVDVFEATSSPDQVTPACPQDLVMRFMPQGGEDLGSPSHVQRVLRLAFIQHQTILPDPDSMISSPFAVPPVAIEETTFDLPPDRDWVIIFDARAGSEALNTTVTANSEVNFEIDRSPDEFTPSSITPPDKPMDPTLWTGCV